MKSIAERQKSYRQRMRKLGLVLRQMWVHPADWPAVKRYAERLSDKRKGALDQ